MKIQFLGTGAAEGVPAVFCTCANCTKIRLIGESEFRTRSQVLLDNIISIDFPPEAYIHSLKFGVELGNIKYLFATHSHMDHFYAHDFILRGYKYAKLKQEKLEIFGNSEVKKVFDECTAREMKSEVLPHIAVNIIESYKEYFVGDYRVLTIPANHSTQEDALLFYIEKNNTGYLHLYDTGILGDEVFIFLKEKHAKVKVVCFDCTFVDNVVSTPARHMGIDNCNLLRKKLIENGITDSNTKYIISHFSHNSNPTRERLKEIEEKYNVVAAYDGYKIEI